MSCKNKTKSLKNRQECTHCYLICTCSISCDRIWWIGHHFESINTFFILRQSTYTFAGRILWQCTILYKVTKLWQKRHKIVKWQKIMTLMPQNYDSKYLNIWRHKFEENHKFVEVWKIVTLMPQICDSTATKLWRYTKKVHNFVAVESQICGIRVIIFHTSTNLWFSTNLCRQMFRC